MFHSAPAPQMLLLLLSWLCPFSRWTPEDHPVPFPFREYSGVCSIIFIISYSAPVFIPFPHRLSYNTLTRAIFPCKTRQFLLCYSGILTKLQRRTKAMDRHSSYTAPRSDRSPASRGSRRSPKTSNNGRSGNENRFLHNLLWYVLPFIVFNLLLLFLVTASPRIELTVGDTTD